MIKPEKIFVEITQAAYDKKFKNKEASDEQETSEEVEEESSRNNGDK